MTNRTPRNPKQIRSWRANQARREAATNKAVQRRDWRASDDARSLDYLTELRNGPGHSGPSPFVHFPMMLLPVTYMNLQRVYCAHCGARMKELE